MYIEIRLHKNNLRLRCCVGRRISQSAKMRCNGRFGRMATPFLRLPTAGKSAAAKEQKYAVTV